ncbi:hypothetical protein EVAR_60152_1 [Eumeta japonica]|uniref:Uncharacterized protein n=1 Tax=Eumeta variegata TaxID=151549 RepID=A0A4C2A1I9_EUMVA|nr:hypothetical protein EVAR_60152_1 [Eumeta japonica]
MALQGLAVPGRSLRRYESCAIHAKRVTIMPGRRLARRIRGERAWSLHERSRFDITLHYYFVCPCRVVVVRARFLKRTHKTARGHSCCHRITLWRSTYSSPLPAQTFSGGAKYPDINVEWILGSRIRRPVSALNGRATAPLNAAIPACGVAPVLRARRVPRASSRFAAYRTAPRVPAPLISFYHGPPRAYVVASHHLRCCGRVDIGRTLLRPPQWINQTSSVPNGRGLDLLREFEALYLPGLPDPQVVVFDPEMDLEYTLPRRQ